MRRFVYDEVLDIKIPLVEEERSWLDNVKDDSAKKFETIFTKPARRRIQVKEDIKEIILAVRQDRKKNLIVVSPAMHDNLRTFFGVGWFDMPVTYHQSCKDDHIYLVEFAAEGYVVSTIIKIV